MRKRIAQCVVCATSFDFPWWKNRKYCSSVCYKKVQSSILRARNQGDEQRAIVAKRNSNPSFAQKVRQGLKRHFAAHPRHEEAWYIARYGLNYVPKKLKYINAWKALSQRLRSQSNCQRCGTKEKLDVHHIIPFAISKDNSLRNLVVLCSSCHKITEDNNWAIYKMVGSWEMVRILYHASFEDAHRPITFGNFRAKVDAPPLEKAVKL